MLTVRLVRFFGAAILATALCCGSADAGGRGRVNWGAVARHESRHGDPNQHVVQGRSLQKLAQSYGGAVFIGVGQNGATCHPEGPGWRKVADTRSGGKSTRIWVR